MPPAKLASEKARPAIFTTEVVASGPVCDEHFRLTLRAQGFPDALPGQFVQIRCGSPDTHGPGTADLDAVATDEQCFGSGAVAAYGRGRPFTRRPFSIGGLRRSGGTCEVDILYRVIGPGTTWMAGLRTGQRVSVIGPLGRPFGFDEVKAVNVVVGGGIGLPPIMWLGRMFAETGRKAIGVCGARSRRLLPLGVDVVEKTGWTRAVEFGGIPVVVATDDGSCGVKGTVVDGLRAALAEAEASGLPARVYACGPEKMLHAVATLAIAKGVACQVCMERMMACGMGTCQSCVIRLRDDTRPEGWRYRLCCQDGPVFDAEQVLW